MANHRRDPVFKRCEVCGTDMLLGGRGRRPLKTKYCSRHCLAKSRIRQTTIKTLAPNEAAYMAGLFDGEGCIVMYDRGYGGRPQLRTTITNTHLGVIDWLLATTGTGTSVPKEYTKPHQAHFKTSYTWQCYGQNAVSLLRQMLPYLIIKRDRALEAIASQEVQRVA